MKWLPFSILSLFFLLGSCGQKEETVTNTPTESEESVIEKTMDEYVKTYNQKNSEKLALFWSSQGVYLNPSTGTSLEGREAIQSFFERQFIDDPNSQLEISLDSIQLINDHLAHASGKVKIQEGGSEVQQNLFVADFVKDNKEWFLQKVHESEVVEPSSNYVHLKDIEWLIGTWKDHSDDIDIIITSKWDGNKNFIFQNFVTKLFGRDQLEGKQIIAWDPIKKRIRSWVFDSDGGFGEGFWTKRDNSWYVAMTYILSDGRRASANNIYTQLDEKTYLWSSFGRDLDGQLLPNIEPVKVYKEDDK